MFDLIIRSSFPSLPLPTLTSGSATRRWSVRIVNDQVPHISLRNMLMLLVLGLLCLSVRV